MSSEERSCYSQNIHFFSSLFLFLCIFKYPMLICCVPSIFVVIVHTTHSSTVIFFLCIHIPVKLLHRKDIFRPNICRNCNTMKFTFFVVELLALPAVEWGALQDGSTEGGCVPRVNCKILLSMWMVIKSTSTVFAEESCWQISLQAH